MKRSIICILIIVILGIVLWYYFDGKMKKLEAERDAAIELAVVEAIELNKSKGVAKEPPVRTMIVYVEKEAPAREPEKPKTAPDMFTDERDGKQYKFVEVDDMTWMADNLNYESEGSWCYEGNADNCNNWGRLYTWNEATEVCPDGWHLPNDEEWGKLIWHFGGNDVAGKALALHDDVAGIFFTGSSDVGKKILQYSGQSNMKRIGLECGGKSPFIVSKSCNNIHRAAAILAKSMFYNQGQTLENQAHLDLSI